MALRKFPDSPEAFCSCPPKYVINVYRACEYDCVYCYGTDFWKRYSPRMLQSTLTQEPSGYPYPKYELLRRLEVEARRKPKLPVLLSAVVDPYTPIERECKLTRRIIEVLSKNSLPILIQTKSDLVLRDLDLLSRTRSAICVSISTLSEGKAERVERKAPSPWRRIDALERISSEGLSGALFLDPIIPYFNDDEKGIEEVMRAASDAGAKQVTMSTLRLKRTIFGRLGGALPELRERIYSLYFEEPEFRGGYYYLRWERRKEIARKVSSIAKKYGLKFFGCRMGFPELNTARSGDGQDLVIE